MEILGKGCDNMQLDGKVAIITGGAMGNGFGIAKTFLKHNIKVVIFDFSDQIGEALGKLKKEFPNGTFLGYKVDIRDKQMVNSCVKAVYDKFSSIDILVNNAGVCKLESFDVMSDEVRDYHFDINIKGTWNVTKAVVPYMRKSETGSIINLSSVTGVRVADPKEVAYATTKAALLGFTKALAADLVSYNIRVNAILPGYIHTPMVDSIAKDGNKENPQSVIDSISKAIPMKRMGTIEELGNLALFLASPLSSYITAEGIVLDGGSTLPETNIVGS